MQSPRVATLAEDETFDIELSKGDVMLVTRKQSPINEEGMRVTNEIRQSLGTLTDKSFKRMRGEILEQPEFVKTALLNDAVEEKVYVPLEVGDENSIIVSHQTPNKKMKGGKKKVPFEAKTSEFKPLNMYQAPQKKSPRGAKAQFKNKKISNQLDNDPEAAMVRESFTDDKQMKTKILTSFNPNEEVNYDLEGSHQNQKPAITDHSGVE